MRGKPPEMASRLLQTTRSSTWSMTCINCWQQCHQDCWHHPRMGWIPVHRPRVRKCGWWELEQDRSSLEWELLSTRDQQEEPSGEGHSTVEGQVEGGRIQHLPAQPWKARGSLAPS